ncbi:MAG: two-component system, NtrC family, sensor histidine kinase PilS [Pseudomonadota bacterium]|nr:two-component system, NtrC family, sensor histidine kinase PilS [Pseudomonadota bacterium]
MSVSAKPGTATPENTYWRPLRHFNFYRATLALALLVLFRQNILQGFLTQTDRQFFLVACIAFFATSLYYLYAEFRRKISFSTQVIAANTSDILLIILLMHFSGGLASGLGMLLIVNIAATGTFLHRRESHLFAALASFGVLAEQTYNLLNSISSAGDYSNAGILGMVFFATSLLASILGNQLRESTALAEARAADLLTLEKLNDDIIQSMRTGILVVDEAGRIRLANDSAESLLGNLPMQNTPRLIDVLPTLHQRLNEWLANPRMHHKPIRQQQGLPDIQPGFRPLDNNKGSTLIFLEDATQLNQRFQQMKLASLGRLTASIAHEIRNPLSAINHAAQLLNESEMNVADKKLTQIINTQVQRLDRIIQNVLQLSRQEPTQLDAIDLLPWLQKFREEFCSAQSLGEQQIEISVSPADTRILFNNSYLHQVLNNLCGNAITHNNKAPADIRIQLTAFHDEQNQPCLDIIDNGPGVAAEQVEQIFDPFYTTSPKGTGLGLFITKEIIESNRARIRYFPVTGGGSCFRIYFLEAVPAGLA